MSEMKSQVDGIIREAISQARMENILKLLQKYKKYILTSLVILAFATITFISFGIYQKEKEEKYSALLQQALIESEKGDVAASVEIVKEIYADNKAPKNVKALASLRYAASFLNAGKIDEAVKIYLEINQNKRYESYVRELSGLLAVKSMIDTNSKAYDKKITDLIVGLEKDSKLLKFFITEQKAVFEWNRGNYKIANGIFTELATSQDEEMDASIKQKAQDMVSIYKSRYATAAEKQAEIDAKSAVKNNPKPVK